MICSNLYPTYILYYKTNQLVIPNVNHLALKITLFRRKVKMNFALCYLFAFRTCFSQNISWVSVERDFQFIERIYFNYKEKYTSGVECCWVLMVFRHVLAKILSTFSMHTFMFIFCVLFQSDLKVVTDAKGGTVYRDHLPCLGNIFFSLHNCFILSTITFEFNILFL